MLKKSRAKRFAGQVYYLHADVASIPLRDRVFDTVVCHSCFPHFQDKGRACVEMSRVTRAGGRVVICHTSSRAEINDLHRQIPAVANDLIPDQDQMKSLLSRAGFTGIEIDDGRESYFASATKTG
jgi:ubiquinone/menaquinone biosynthesis C-methylase UbiE